MRGRSRYVFHMVCLECGKKFDSHHPGAKYCCHRCQLDARAKREAEYAEEKKSMKPNGAGRVKKKLVDGVPVGVAEKVREALKYGVSYGKLQTIKAQAAAKKARERKAAKRR